MGEDVEKFTFENCSSIFGTYFYAVRHIKYCHVSITEREGNTFFRPVFSKYGGKFSRAV
ncbi:hypothetical protein ICU_00451 [Bacillus cereus BAG2X1-1]|nr:hypothetical protein ICU_00451 [Bacillus cereus BAG2X1-1]